MKRFYYKDKQADGDQKVFDQGFKSGYAKGYKSGKLANVRAMKRAMMVPPNSLNQK